MLQSELTSKQYRGVLLILMLSIGLVLFAQIRFYFSGFMGALTLYVLLRPQMVFLTKKWNFHRGLAAFLIILEALFIFLIPLITIGFIVVDTISSIDIDPNFLKNWVTELIDNIESRFNIMLITADNLSFIPKLGGNIVQIVAMSSYSFLINLVVILLVLYFMLFSFEGFETTIREILPFRQKNKNIFINESKLIIQANAIGIPLLAIIQGFFGYIGYLFFGIDNPLLYAVITAFVSIIPIVGTAVVYVPLAVGLYFQPQVGAAIGLIIYGFLVIGNIDYVARFLLQKKLANIHPLITIFGVLIGIPMFGFWGVIFGPLLISMFMLFFNMYRHDYIEGSVARPSITMMEESKTQHKWKIKSKFPYFYRESNEKR